MHPRDIVCGVMLFAACIVRVAGQAPAAQPVQPVQNGMSGGIASAGTFKAVYDDQKRPITAGGFVDKGVIVFQNVTQAAGLSVWHHEMGTPQKKYILETD